jgi:hypothetical protein
MRMPSLSLSLLLLGFATGWAVVGCQAAGAGMSDPSPTPIRAPTQSWSLPRRDVPGTDISSLPRYANSTRVEYRRAVEGEFIVTEVEYVTQDGLEAVHSFYRDVFRAKHWSVADLGFSQGEWTFFLISGAREAVVEIESRGPVVEVEIELSEPQPGGDDDDGASEGFGGDD